MHRLTFSGLPQVSRRALGFTLIELLIVTAVIAVLIGILLPTLTRLRVQASRVNDLSNIRQLAAACINYAAENRGNWPLGSRLGNDVTTPSDNDDVGWVNTWTFAYFLGYTTNRGIADDWLAAPSTPEARMDEPLRRNLACVSMMETPDQGMYACVGLPLFRYDPYNQGTFMSFMGYDYWGGRPPRITGSVFDNHGNVSSPASGFAFPLKQGGPSSFDVLLSCDAFSSGVGQEMPHCGGNDAYLVTTTATLCPGDGLTDSTAVMKGLCCAYTDGSARWVPRSDLWSVTSGAGYWYYFDGTHNR